MASPSIDVCAPRGILLFAVTGELESIEHDEEESSESKASPQQLRDAMLAGAFIGSVEVIDDCLRKGAELTAS